MVRTAPCPSFIQERVTEVPLKRLVSISPLAARPLHIPEQMGEGNALPSPSPLLPGAQGPPLRGPQGSSQVLLPGLVQGLVFLISSLPEAMSRLASHPSPTRRQRCAGSPTLPKVPTSQLACFMNAGREHEKSSSQSFMLVCMDTP